jgi:sugar O-acyltransferase (sialic acid O-acetyltransferase NeuD family)
MSNIEIVILGAGGDALVIAEIVRAMEAAGERVRLRGFLDDNLAGGMVDGLPVLGRLEEWATLGPELAFVPAIHKLKQMVARKARLEGLCISPERWASAIHPTAVVARSASIGVGVSIAAHVVIQPESVVGSFATLRAGANLGHDARCGDYTYVGPNATLCGRAAVEEGAHIGPNAVIVDGQTVGAFAVVGAGTVVTKRIPGHEVHFGVPARFVQRLRK